MELKTITIDEGYKLVKENKERSFKWCYVKNKHGNIFEFGGNHKKFKVSVFQYNEKGEVEFNSYDRPMNNYYLGMNLHPDDGINYESEEAILNDCRNHNFIEQPSSEIIYEEYTVIEKIEKIRRYDNTRNTETKLTGEAFMRS